MIKKQQKSLTTSSLISRISSTSLFLPQSLYNLAEYGNFSFVTSDSSPCGAKVMRKTICHMKFHVFCTLFSLTLIFPSNFLSYLNLFRVKNLRLRRLSYKENAVWKFLLKRSKFFQSRPLPENSWLRLCTDLNSKAFESFTYILLCWEVVIFSPTNLLWPIFLAILAI